MRLICLTLLVLVSCLPILAQEVAKLDRTTQEKLKVVGGKMSAAMRAEDKAEVRLQFQQAIELMGDQAGLPESADEFRTVPKDARDLAASELPKAFDLYIPYIERQRWWRIGLDPSKTNHSLREIAAVIEGCLAARQISEANSAKLLAIAREAGDFLTWAQDQAGTGVLPFPAVRDGKGRPFEVAEAFYRRAEQNGTLDQVISNGWSVDDFDDGGLQFDNGLAGVALVHLYESTDDEQYERAAVRAADWAVSRRVVTNWNYNSFSVFLLAETYRITSDEKYLASAKKKALLGVLPGQLTEMLLRRSSSVTLTQPMAFRPSPTHQAPCCQLVQSTIAICTRVANGIQCSLNTTIELACTTQILGASCPEILSGLKAVQTAIRMSVRAHVLM